MSKNVQAPSPELMALPQEVSQMICVQLFKHTALQMDLAPGVGCDIHYIYTHCSRSMLMTCKQIRQSWLHYFLLHTQLEILFTKPKDSDYCQYLGDILRFIPDSVMATLQSVDINPLPAAALEDCTTHEGLHMRYVRYACLRRCRNIQQIRVRECLGITTLARLGINILQAASSLDHLSQVIAGSWTQKSWPSCCVSHAAKHISCEITKITETDRNDSDPMYTLVSHFRCIPSRTRLLSLNRS